MNANGKWMKWAVELQALAQDGLAYTRNPFDIERFERIRDIAAEMVSEKSDVPLDKVRDLFSNETGYQTPKIECRAAVIENGKILLVQESNGLWALPGGWVDAGLSVGENVLKEAREEAGLTVSLGRVVAVQDRDKHNLPIYIHKICKVFVLCRALGGEFRPNIETLGTGYFAMDGLPPLATEKTTQEQIAMCFAAERDPHWQTLID